MKILFLGPSNSNVYHHLCDLNHRVIQHDNPINLMQAQMFDFIVSHGYRNIVPEYVCREFDGRAINLHISYLPWNRGADPNLWSWVDGTPQGVTIHYIDSGLDTGDIIYQKLVPMIDGETLSSSYHRLQNEMLHLFVSTWGNIANRICPRTPQFGEGSYHKTSDKDSIAHLLTNGWDTDVRVLQART